MQEKSELVHPNDTRTDTPSLQPMGFTDILDGIFVIYRDHFRLLLAIAAVYLVLEYGMDIVFAYLLNAEAGVSIVVLGVFTLATVVVVLLVNAGLTYASTHIYLRKAITPRDAFRQAARRFWPYLGSNILWLLGCLGLFITVFGIPFAIYFSIRWSLYSFPVLLEETNAWNSLGRSSELVEGSWWRVSGITVAIYLISGMITVILYIFVEFVLTLAGIIEIGDATSLLDSLRRIVAPSLDDMGWFSYTIQRFVMLGIGTFTMPIGIIGFMLLYFDLRIRKEAFDIEMRAPD